MYTKIVFTEKSFHDVNFVVTGCIVGYYNDTISDNGVKLASWQL